MYKPQTQYKVGLALSGGTAKSVAHVGVIRALTESGIEIDYISGTSGGSIAAVAFANGMSIEEMEQNALSLSWKKLARIRLSRLGFVSSKPIEGFVHKVFGTKDLRFEDLKIPCAVPCTDLYTGSNRVFSSGDVARVIRMSCSLPHFYMPVDHGGRYYVDGGLSEYLPVGTVRDLGAQFAIGVNLGTFDEEMHHKPKYFFELFMQINNLVARQNMALSRKLADYLIEPDMTQYNAFDFRRKQEMIDYGYEFTLGKIDEIKAAYDSKQSFLKWFRQNLPSLKRKPT